MNITNVERMQDLITAISSQDSTMELPALTDMIMEHVDEQILNTGYLFRMDVYHLHTAGLLPLEMVSPLTSALLNKFSVEHKVVTRKESDYVFTVECKNKVMTLLSLTKIQKMIYDLFPASPTMAKKAIDKLDKEEQELIRTVLTFER